MALGGVGDLFEYLQWPNKLQLCLSLPKGISQAFFKGPRWGKQGAFTICMENPVIPGRIQMERFILVESFRQKSNTFRGITFFPLLTETTEIFCIIIVWLANARLPFEAEDDLF